MLGKSKKASSSEDARTNVNTIIGEGAVFDGNLSAPETIRIDGIINGNCTCEKKLILGANGQIKGNIYAQDLVISGKVDGDISATGKLELLSTGKINGNIIARSLVIDENASFDGRCTMAVSLPDHASNDNPATEEKTDEKTNEKETSEREHRKH
ncbi:bactofilin family protein [Parablautia muri]|uniref:Polymer-forming cytoskeletal protein n=1 Tax=Parablautia muri TaxID=2320879 RepID=A0A9X5GSH3_9FIRM|nr:polymer-forming cytoskeletal protein [Parablautia muri]NBJ93071.1 polymer-forming cytoskeletal protein [Parablautia muri]